MNKLDRRRAHYAANRAQQIDAAKAWAAANVEHVKARQAAYYEARPHFHAARGMVRKARLRAEENKVPFDAEFMTSKNIEKLLLAREKCPCCKARLSYGRKSKVGPSDRSPSLDRIFCEDGYVPGNVDVLCWRCNRLKGNATEDDLRAILAYIENRL